MKDLTPIEREKRIQVLLSDDETALEAIKEERDTPALEVAMFRVRAMRPAIREALANRLEELNPKPKASLGNKGQAMMRHGIKRKRERLKTL